MATIKEILSMSLEDRRNLYEAKGIDKVIIDGITFSGYGAFSFLWEKSYIKEPTRSGDGTIGNLNSYATFLTPHLKINFSLLSIDDYRKIMTLIEEKNEFLVSCYDVVHNTITQNKMYFTTEEMPKLFYLARVLNGEEYVELLAVEDYTVEMVGTNAPKNEINVVYYGLQREDGSRELLVDGSTSGVENTEFLVGENIEVPEIEGYSFDGSWERANVKSYINNEEYRLKLLTQKELDSKTIVFYANSKPNNTHILSLSYGMGKPKKDDSGAEITAIEFVTNDTIGNALSRANISLWEGGVFSDLPISPNPTIVVNEKVYDTYTRVGWYETATIPLDSFGNLSAPLTKDSLLSVNGNMIIYELFKPVQHKLTLDSNGGTTYSDLINVDYGASIALPTPYKKDYVFMGWYSDKNFNTKFEGTMPPYDITIYAQWEKIDV